MKICSTCRQRKILDSFYKRKDTKDGCRPECKDCSKTLAKKSRKYISVRDRPPFSATERSDRHRALLLKRDFNLTILDYNRMFEEQSGCCAICKRHQSELKKRLAVDHCHNSGEIRGLLCHHCNLGLGQFRDNAVLLFEAIEYLEKTKIITK